MEWILWIVIVLLFLLSFIGVFVPVIPDAVLVWAGFLIYHFFLAETSLPVSFWWAMGILTLILVAADFLSNLVFVKKYGGSRWGMVASMIGLLVGPFVLGPLGILLGPLLAVLLAEWLRNKDVTLSAKIAASTIIAFFGSAVVKIGIQIVMIIWFIIVI